MSSPFTLVGSLNYPLVTGQASSSVPLTYVGAFDSSVSAVIDLKDTGTTSVSFGSVDMAKGILLQVDAAVDAAPVVVRLNGLAQNDPGSIEVSPGGFIAMGSPIPIDGVVSINLDWTTNNTVRVWIFG